MPKHCVVKGCKSMLKDGFPFPLDRPDFVKKWVQALEKHQELSDEYEGKVVCPAHFKETDFLKSKKNQINKKAIPSVFPDIPFDYVSEDEEVSTVPKAEIKHEPEHEDTLAMTVGGKTLRGTRLTIPITEPDSEEDEGSNYEPSDSNEDEEMTFSEEESERMENDSQDNTMDYQNDTCDTEMMRSSDTNIMFPDLGNDDAMDSDYEPVTEVSLEALHEMLQKKTKTLKKETSTLGAMEEMIKNQSSTIRKLEEELAELIKSDGKENKNDKTPEGANPVPRLDVGNKAAVYSNVDLQIFTLSLYYFSPKVYSYLESIMPYLPPKSVLIDWIQSGHAFTLFPPGVLLKENFVLE